MFWGLQLVFPEKFCNSKVFQPICSGEEIIHITSASYRRQKFGRSLKKGRKLNVKFMKMPNDINFSNDPRHIIEPQCAGQQHCEVYGS